MTTELALPWPVAVVGPTASGKSALGIALAQRYDGEIVNVDSMQLYRHMDIGTAKLSITERSGIPHHLLDIWEVSGACAGFIPYQKERKMPCFGMIYKSMVFFLIGIVVARNGGSIGKKSAAFRHGGYAAKFPLKWKGRGQARASMGTKARFSGPV